MNLRKVAATMKQDNRRAEREDTIAEMLRYLCRQDKRLLKASDHMLMHLCRLAQREVI